MSSITLEQAETIVKAALAHGTEQGFNPLTVAVLDPGGVTVALARQDGSGNLRPDIAVAKAWGVLGMGMTNRAIAARAADSPEFFTSVANLAGGRILSVPGGVFVLDADGQVIGAVGVTGDASLNDEAAAVAGIEAAGLTPVTGAES
ncbi:GlcG/HbpS family heme-binding protein [Pseudonocardia bannensis]|uniref:Heme-binding protein n=1 Tax=Pseudonocardia bannensis TaxID=630973 RepID=A0A848DQK8_9PSEU|nr:heme-binding protein [Pseudonocardia bannensis]NMH95140.1 heme-binding protein [Pseudonocardia bannensis]